MELVPTADCGAEHAVCTAAGDKLLEGVSVLVPGLPAFSVADAEVEEGPGARLDFEVTLSRASAVRVQVRFETADGTARALPAEEAARYAGEGSLEAQRDCARGGYNGDYMAASGQLLFEAGVTARTVSVAVCDDAHDEGSETMRLRLTRVEVVEGIWVSSRIADGEATGTIRNSDHMPRAWLSRFGRTAAEQVLDAVEGRLSAGRSPAPRSASSACESAARTSRSLERATRRTRARCLGTGSAATPTRTPHTASTREPSPREPSPGAIFSPAPPSR